MQKTKTLNLLLTLLVFVLFFFKGLVFLDPDFGWRVVAGNYYAEFGIPQTDLFSYTMPDFRWVDHAWLSSLVIGVGEKNFGRFFLSFVFSLVAVATIFITVSLVSLDFKNPKPKYWLGKLGLLQNLGFGCLVSILFLFFGIRAQVFSWLGFALFLWMVFDEKRRAHTRNFLPILFWVWANVHGSFVMGLAVYAILVAAGVIRRKNIIIPETLIFALSIIVTFINPYGGGIWREVFSSVLDRDLPARIVEWMPAFTMLNLVMIFYVPFSAIFLFVERKNIKIEWLIIYVLFLGEAMLSRRHLPIWAILTYPLTTQALNHFYLRVKDIKFGIKRFGEVYTAFFIICLLLVITELFLDVSRVSTISEDYFYPKEAVSYISQHKLKNRIFTDYAWGGYLIWKLPGEKVFIDGRMPSWKDKSGYKVMDEYVGILKSEIKYNDIFEKYEIYYVLLPKRSNQNPKISDIPIVNYIAKKISPKNPVVDFESLLKSDGWTVEFEDAVSRLYSKK